MNKHILIVKNASVSRALNSTQPFLYRMLACMRRGHAHALSEHLYGQVKSSCNPLSSDFALSLVVSDNDI